MRTKTKRQKKKREKSGYRIAGGDEKINVSRGTSWRRGGCSWTRDKVTHAGLVLRAVPASFAIGSPERTRGMAPPSLPRPARLRAFALGRPYSRPEGKPRRRRGRARRDECASRARERDERRESRGYPRAERSSPRNGTSTSGRRRRRSGEGATAWSRRRRPRSINARRGHADVPLRVRISRYAYRMTSERGLR